MNVQRVLLNAGLINIFMIIIIILLLVHYLKKSSNVH